jgi:excisionase family DNA binding protein
MAKYETSRQDNEGEEFTVAEAATYLGRSIEQVRRYLRDGALAGYHVGRQWFVPAAAVATLKASRVETPAMKEQKEILRQLKALRAELLQKYGYLQVDDWVAEAREGLR